MLEPGAQPRVIEHSGVFSTSHSDAVLLPGEGYGIVLLDNSNHAFANYNGIKQGLIERLTGELDSRRRPGCS